MSIRKNVASQKIRVFAFDLITGEPLTGDAAQITCKVALDWGSATALGDINPTEVEDGYYLFDLTQAETNGDVLDFYPESTTTDAQVVAVPGTVYTLPEGLYTAGENYSATRGLAGTALPAAAADAAGGLPISDAGGLDIDSKIGGLTVASGRVDANITAIGGSTTVDTLSLTSLFETILAYVAGETSVTDLGGGSKRIIMNKQNGSTEKLRIDFNANGEWTATTIT